MTYYNFKDNVYLVRGAVNSCLYDLNHAKLYQINPDLTHALLELIEKNQILHESLYPVIDELMGYELLEQSNSQKGWKDIKELAEERKQIQFAWINVTDRCNLQCIHCFQESSPTCSNEMELDDFKRVVQELVVNGVKTIQIFGGEPLLLQERLVEMIDYSREHFPHYEIFTNGTLINDEWIEVFKKYKPLMRISLHSFIREEQEKVTGVKGSYDRVYQAIELLEQNEVPYVVTMTEMKGICRGECNIQGKVSVAAVKMAGRADLRLMDADILKSKLITEETFTQPVNVDQLKTSLVQHNCYGQKIYVDTNLDIYPCASDKQRKHGNLKEMALRDLIQDDLRSLTKDVIHICNQCEYRYACFDCRSDRLEPDQKSKPWICTYDPLTGEWQDIDWFVKRWVG